MSYRGAGLYQHYKGGMYRVWGIGQHESSSARLVIYNSLDAEHEATRLAQGVDFVLRPLNEEDITSHRDKDPFNSYVKVDGKSLPRFERVLLHGESPLI